MNKKIIWILFATLAVVTGFYPGIYLFLDRRFGLLSTKSDALLADLFWNLAFYTHITLAGLALLIGWIQFSTSFRNKNLSLHRLIGKIYVVSALLSSLAGIYIGFFATGGIVSSSGFVLLGIIWFYTTLKAYLNVREKKIADHQKMMIYSYAACFAGVALRLWLPLLIYLTGDFIIAYRTVAWLCWVPNLVVANNIIRRIAP